MDLSVQNKNFLSLLHELDIDIKQFPDLSFDGLFENVPEDVNYFFNWFMDNITSDNALTRAEQAMYLEMERSQTLPTEEEMNYILSSCSPTYEELEALDITYIKDVLPEYLEQLNTTHKELTRIYSNLESESNEIKKKATSLEESLNKWRKQLNTVRDNCNRMNELCSEKLDEVQKLLLTEPDFEIDVNAHEELLAREQQIFNMLQSSKLLQNEVLLSTNLDVLPKLEEDLTQAEISLALSKASLIEKKKKIEVLTKLIQQKSTENCFNESVEDYYVVESHERMYTTELIEEIKITENELYKIIKDLAHDETQKILSEYYLKKIDLYNIFLSKVTTYRDYIKSNKTLDSQLVDILIKCARLLEKSIQLKKECQSKLNESEKNISSDIINLELRKQRFKEVSAQMHQHPIVLALKNSNLGDNPENVEETLKKIIELMQHITYDSDIITPRFRNDLQSLIKSLFDNTLCGPTSQLLFVPIELLIKFQNCEECNNELSQVIKRLANKYLVAKKSISAGDRKRLLLWIDFLTNPSAIEVKMKNSPESLGKCSQ